MLVVDLLFPNRCLHCNDTIAGNEIICEECYANIDFAHWDHLSPNPLQEKLNGLCPVEEAYALMHFEKKGLSQVLLHQLKYGNREIIGKKIAEWCIERIHLESKPNVIVSVPIHASKLKKRGYNQLHLFAETLSKAWNIPHHADFLKRNQSIKSQAHKDRKHRQNESSKFDLQKPLQNKHILLVDDVCTTGNTIATCVWKILQEPGNRVSVLIMAMD